MICWVFFLQFFLQKYSTIWVFCWQAEVWQSSYQHLFRSAQLSGTVDFCILFTLLDTNSGSFPPMVRTCSCITVFASSLAPKHATLHLWDKKVGRNLNSINYAAGFATQFMGAYHSESPAMFRLSISLHSEESLQIGCLWSTFAHTRSISFQFRKYKQ